MFNLNKLCKAIATSVLAVSMLSSIATADVFDDKSKAEIEKIVDEYVSNHPEVIIKAMKKLEAQEMAKQQAAISDTVSLLRSNKDLPSVGKSDAKHFIIDFYDFNCGYCKVMEPLFEKALKDYDLQIVYVNIPVIKDESKQLAVVGQAIFNLDQKAYFKFHKHYMQPGHLAMDTDSIKASVEDSGISWDKVVKEMESGRPQKQIGMNIKYSADLKVAGTPYLIIDGHEVRGAITNYNRLKAELD